MNSRTSLLWLCGLLLVYGGLAHGQQRSMNGFEKLDSGLADKKVIWILRNYYQGKWGIETKTCDEFYRISSIEGRNLVTKLFWEGIKLTTSYVPISSIKIKRFEKETQTWSQHMKSFDGEDKNSEKANLTSHDIIVQGYNSNSHTIFQKVTVKLSLRNL
jgi:hypothetical protein